MAFDLSSAPGLALQDTSVLVLKHPVSEEILTDDKGKEVTITLYGKSSKQYRNAVTAMQNRELRRKAKKETATADQMREEAVNLLVACSADSTLELDGEPVNDKDSFRKLYSDARFSWIYDQVDSYLGDIDNFLSK